MRRSYLLFFFSELINQSHPDQTVIREPPMQFQNEDC